LSNPVQIVIPSHKRPERVHTMQVVADAVICIPESQKKDYARYWGDDVLVTHPDSVVGLTAKRQWIYEHFGNVFMLDDDIRDMRRLYPLKKARVRSRNTARDIIYATADAARQAGAYLFGFNKNPNPASYRSHKPISLTGYVTGCAHGLLEGSKLYYDTNVVVNEDFWISALNAYHHRYCYKDMRFTFMQQQTHKNPGGLAEFRNLKTEEADYKYLVDKFGKDVIRLKEDTKLRKRNHPFEKTIYLPF